MIKIIVDSTVDLSEEFIKEHNVDIISLQVSIDDKTYRDMKEINVNDVYKAIHEDRDIKTSLPLLTDMEELFTQYAKEGTDFVFFTFSSLMSGTFNAARLIIEELEKEYDTKMDVIDTKNGGIASALIVKRFVTEKDEYSSFEEKAEFAKSLADKVAHIFLVNDLAQLRKGGRITMLKALVGSILSVKPVLFINNGVIDIYKNAIGEKRALRELMKFVNDNAKDKNKLIGLNYVEHQDIFEKAKKALIDNGYHDFIQQRLASVMTAHIGVNAVSISFFTD